MPHRSYSTVSILTLPLLRHKLEKPHNIQELIAEPPASFGNQHSIRKSIDVFAEK